VDKTRVKLYLSLGLRTYAYLNKVRFAATLSSPSRSVKRIHSEEIHSFINGSTVLLLGSGLFFSFVIFFTQTVGLLGRRSVRRKAATYTQTTQTQNKCTHTDIHSLSGIRTHDPSIRASEDSSCLRPRGHCDRLPRGLSSKILYETIVSHFADICLERR
jgi:hypothetical protein